ncbi:acyltransferase [Arenicella chitinivorans]|uniref:Acyltransferase n=1 Tax=Arenicella chitinivorans TaxID=1329800 RepID=A0A918RZK1_9GAMM|nr:lysophospholipid acyltransferase family protein [Arenicella chitinivorans]GHA14683.1 acyltransferase [Arenicella chitinivorans]
MAALSFNHYWRIVAAGFSYVLFGLGALLPGLYILVLGVLPLDTKSRQRKVRRVIQKLCYVYINIMQGLGLMQYTVHGAPPKDLQGHMVISNHTMLIDALFALALVENLCCVVKASLCHNVFTRGPIRLAGYIPNNDPGLVNLAATKLDGGENLLIFPEGTRNQYDLQLDFKRGAANIAVISDAPILPILMCCSPRALGKDKKWYQLPPVKSQITIEFHPVLRVTDCIDTSEPRTRQYRKLTQWLRDYYHDAVSRVTQR